MLFSLSIFAAVVFCLFPVISTADGDLSPATLTVTADPGQLRQQIEGFGASDCWSIQHVGNWPQEKREAIADLLFSNALDDHGKPTGIGLSHWRFNIGAGSSRDTNPETRIRDPWRRADTFFNEDFSDYDWHRLEGQRQFLHDAKARGVTLFTAFANSPPVHMTRNGFAYCDTSVGSTNLRDDSIDDYANFLADVLARFRDHEQIDFTYVSPFNEPQWDWNGPGQEGCRYSVTDMKPVVDALSAALHARQLDTKILVCDSGELPDLQGLRRQDHNYVHAFFNPDSDTYIGFHDNVAPTISGHSYFSCWPRALTRAREGLPAVMAEHNIRFAMTEYCILIPGGLWAPKEYRGWGNGRDLGIAPALWIARVIHYDLVVAGAIFWEWWLGVSPYNYKDGLVYCDKDEQDGAFYESKMLWAMGNFSRFIRPGMHRIAVTRSDNRSHRETEEGLMVSGYYCTKDQAAVLVFVNYTGQPRMVKPQLRNPPVNPDAMSWIPYVTAGDDLSRDNLSPRDAIQGNDVFQVPAQSVVTLVSAVS